jgi:hypothetical protein
MKFTIESKKNINEILEIIRNNTYINKTLFVYSNNGKYFNGQIFEKNFKIQRCINYKNSFLPVIIGNIEKNDTGAKINILMRLNKGVKAFGFFWFTFVIIFCFIVPFVKLDMPFCFIPYIMLVFGILLFTLPYKREIKTAKDKLEELLM